ncbi:MAG: SpoIVB peptidase S55 domain-containing protein [Fimbriimonadales bacterium]
MRWFWHICWMGLLVSAFAQENPDVRAMMRDVFPVARVKPGMKGYGLSVFKGTKIERFEVEVIGVLEQANFGRPLVMIMMRGGPITERGAMVIAGMSGSPIFIEGKILGALAYGFAFPKEPVALVTPLEAMLTNLHPRAEQQLAQWGQPRLLSKPIRVGGVRYAGVYIGHEPPRAPNVAWARPLMTPLMVSGASPRTLKRLEALLQPYGIMPVMGGGAATEKRLPVQFQPGAAVGAPLATGDLDLTAIGTLTYRNDDYVLAFGHPFLGVGALETPMTAAEIVDVFSSYAASFKLGNRAQTLGAVYYDGAFAIAGRVGQQARMMPMRMRVTNLETGMQREFRCEIIRHRLLTADIAASAASEFLDRVHFSIGDATATVRWRLETRPYGEIRFENRVATRDALIGGVLGDLMYVMNLVSNAPEQNAALESLEMEVVIQPGERAALIESLQVDKFTYRPGESIEARAMVRLPNGVLQPYNFTIRIPEDALPTRYMLQVGAGGSAGRISVPAGLLALLLGAEEGFVGSGDTESRLREFLQSERNFQLVATLNMPMPTLSVNGAPLLQPPPIVRSVLIGQRVAKVRTTADRIKQVLDTPSVLQGSQSVAITVLPSETGRFPYGAGAPYDMTDAEEESEEEASEEPLRPPMETPPGFGGSPPLPELSALESSESASASPPTRRERPVSRAPRTWQPNDFAQLRRGTFEGVALQMDGTLRLSLARRHTHTTPLEYIWSALGDDTGLLVGGGVKGRTLRVGQDSAETPYPELPGAFVTALARSENGELYAGVAPEGEVYRVGMRGYERVLRTGARYINALLWREGVLYIATGAPARVLAWDGNTLLTLLTLEETHCTTLAVDSDGALYVGVSERGVVYRISPTGGATPMVDLPEPNIMALATDDSGNLYIAAAPSGNLYRRTPDGRLEPLHPQGRLNWRSLIRHGQTLYALTDSEVYALSLTEARPQPVLMYRQQGLQLVGGGVSGETLQLASADGRVIVLAPSDTGVYLSPVLEVDAPAQWGALRWSATLPDGAEVVLQTRSGNTREPDASWSQWSAPYLNPDGSTVLSPPAQYLQVRVQLKAAGEKSPVLNQFSLHYMPANRPPEVQLLGLQPYAALSDTTTIRWRGRDLDGDALRFEPQLSRDGGRTWEPLKNGILSRNNASASRPMNAPTNEVNVAITDIQITDIQIDEAVPEAVREALRQQIARDLQERLSTDDAEETPDSERPARSQFVWHTKQTPDGVYLVRVMATDQPASPTDYATVYSPAVPVVVCNTPPTLRASEHSVQVSDGVVELSGFALQALAAAKSRTNENEPPPASRLAVQHSVSITGVQYKIGNGEWLSAEPVDGMFDSAFEGFRIRTPKLPAGEHTLIIKAFNAAGKSAQVEQKVTVKP